ncbi:VOC family protein [Ilumatobacter sp.]|uniref:VOC family protein n=1 Tax=Ilumatobacter sp. TaxID=1967498 RepID=UPI00345DCBA6
MVTLGVADVARATTFYESLGWRSSSSSNDQVAFFRMQGSVLGLHGREPLADDAAVDADGSGFRAVTLALNCDSPAEVDAVFDEWVAAGATAVKEPQPVFWGGYSSYVADPDGHLWEIAHNPYSPNDDSGRMTLQG